MIDARNQRLRGHLALAIGIALAACSSRDSSGPASPQEHDASADTTPEDASADSTFMDAASESTNQEAATQDVAVGDDALAQDAASEPDNTPCKLIKKYSSSNPTCNDCAEQHCFAEINACLTDLECDDTYVNCILACALSDDDAGDAGMVICMEACAQQAPKGKAEYEAAIGCADAKCKTECL